MTRPDWLGPPMPAAVSDLRQLCLVTVATDEMLRRRGSEGCDPERVYLSRILFALTASTDAIVLAAIEQAIGVAERGG